MPDLIEEEFNDFKFHGVLDSILKETQNLLRNPLLILPSEHLGLINRRIPSQLEYPEKLPDILRVKIKIFLTLRYLVTHLALPPQPVKNEINPITREQTVIHSWEKSKSYVLPTVNVELILCNERVSKNMCIRYVMIDPEFFILLEPDFSVPNENRIIIH